MGAIGQDGMTDLKEKLLGAAGLLKNKSKRGGSQNGDSSRDGSGKLVAYNSEEEEVLQRMRERQSRGRGSSRLRRRFLQRLAVALHSYGSSASRTEYLIEKAAGRLDIHVNIAVFPALILLTFPGFDDDESVHVLTVESELDVDKLGRADQLANQVGQSEFEETPLLLAYWRLRTIATSAPRFGRWWWRLFGYTLSASTSALMFFDGSPYDGLISLILGFVVGICDLIASTSSIFSTVLNFVTALVISLGARLFSVYLPGLNLCFSSLVLGSLVQLLPGLMLTIGVSEMVAKSHVTGTSRIMYALFAALQLGFGIAVGEQFVFWESKSLATDCVAPDLSLWWNCLWFAGFTASSIVLLNARLDQWMGMIVTSAVGYVVWLAANSLKLDSSASSVAGAFAVGITGTAYSHVRGDVPLVMTLAGILLLVPGGIGVKGVAVMMEDDVISGMGFVFNMMVVSLSITLGLLLSKIAIPAALFGTNKTMAHNKSTLAAQLLDDKSDSSSSSEEEDMAI